LASQQSFPNLQQITIADEDEHIATLASDILMEANRISNEASNPYDGFEQKYKVEQSVKEDLDR
jgi:hypothetical protein